MISTYSVQPSVAVPARAALQIAVALRVLHPQVLGRALQAAPERRRESPFETSCSQSTDLMVRADDHAPDLRVRVLAAAGDRPADLQVYSSQLGTER